MFLKLVTKEDSTLLLLKKYLLVKQEFALLDVSYSYTQTRVRENEKCTVNSTETGNNTVKATTRVYFFLLWTCALRCCLSVF